MLLEGFPELSVSAGGPGKAQLAAPEASGKGEGREGLGVGTHKAPETSWLGNHAPVCKPRMNGGTRPRKRPRQHRAQPPGCAASRGRCDGTPAPQARSAADGTRAGQRAPRARERPVLAWLSFWGEGNLLTRVTVVVHLCEHTEPRNCTVPTGQRHSTRAASAQSCWSPTGSYSK